MNSSEFIIGVYVRTQSRTTGLNNIAFWLDLCYIFVNLRAFRLYTL